MKPYYEENGITIYHGDCREILPSLAKVDLVLTDPPYGKLKIFNRYGGYAGGQNSKDKLMMVGNRGPHLAKVKAYGRYTDEGKFDIGPFLKLIDKKFDYLILWGGNYFQMPIRTSWLCWDKSAGNESWYSQFELAWTNLPQPAKIFHHVWQGMIRAGEPVDRQHPTEKPVELLRWCLNFVPHAQSILDPFMGSGTTLRAAKDLGRKATGIEIEEKYCEIAAKRLSQEVFDFSRPSESEYRPTEKAGDLFELESKGL